jgi:carbon monoxide dehydrogenase subunit G
MPESKIRLIVAGSAESIWPILTDPAFLASTIPGIISVVPRTPSEATWTIEIRQGFIHRKLTLEVIFRPSHGFEATFSAQAKEVQVEGSVRLAEADVGRTAVELQIHYEGKGPLRHIINNLASKAFEEYPDRVRTRLESQFRAPGT